ncbi:MAG: hypothetical protein RMJ48_05000 [Roseiflexaceae bacterium]|nr:hypothetical protein [Roseiflexus sp.]MDW8145645.1 hypothetical protein [Roseiflexaceae bacterium]
MPTTTTNPPGTPTAMPTPSPVGRQRLMRRGTGAIRRIGATQAPTAPILSEMHQ